MNKFFEPKFAGVAIGRWALGLFFFYSGLVKIMGGVSGFVNGYLVPLFSKTFLPSILVTSYGYVLPYVELILGILLIVGIFRNAVLFLTGLTLISLTFGQMLLQQHAVVANNFIYIFLTAILLFLSEFDGWAFGMKKVKT
jgi:thiosulfate dehydrogenase [quinone] large subunit